MKLALNLIMTAVVVTPFAINLCGCNNGGSTGGGFAPVNSSQPNQPNLKDDHGDTSGFASTLNLGLTETGKIETASDVDYFVFVASGNQNGKRYEFKLNSNRELNMEVGGVPNYGIAPSITITPNYAGPIYIKVTPRPGVNDATYTLSVKDVSLTTPPAPPIAPIRFEILPDQSGKSPREIGATASGNVLKLKAIAAVSSTSVSSMRIRLQDSVPAVDVTIILRDAQGTYIGSESGKGDTFGDTQVITNRNANNKLFELSQAGYYAEIYIYANVSPHDNVLYTTTLQSASIWDSAGHFHGAAPYLNETVLVEAMPDVAFFAQSSTVATVTSGSSVADITSFRMQNRDQVHVPSLTNVYVYRETNGDTAPLTLTQNGFVLAHGTNYSYFDWGAMKTVHYTYFYMPQGTVNIVPGSMVDITLTADLSQSHHAELVYTIRSVDLYNDNGQSMGQQVFIDQATFDFIKFKVRQQ